jgi:hypothetical protein
MVWMPNGSTSGASDSIQPSTPNFDACGVVDQHVDAAESLDGCLDRSLGVLWAGDVKLDDQQVGRTKADRRQSVAWADAA